MAENQTTTHKPQAKREEQATRPKPETSYYDDRKRNVLPNRFGWYDAKEVLPPYLLDTNARSNPLLGLVNGKAVAVMFRYEVDDDDEGGYFVPLGHYSGAFIENHEIVTHWMPLPRGVVFRNLDGEVVEPGRPWTGPGVDPQHHAAPTVDFWHQQRAILKCESKWKTFEA